MTWNTVQINKLDLDSQRHLLGEIKKKALIAMVYNFFIPPQPALLSQLFIKSFIWIHCFKNFFVPNVHNNETKQHSCLRFIVWKDQVVLQVIHLNCWGGSIWICVCLQSPRLSPCHVVKIAMIFSSSAKSERGKKQIFTKHF